MQVRGKRRKLEPAEHIYCCFVCYSYLILLLIVFKVSGLMFPVSQMLEGNMQLLKAWTCAEVPHKSKLQKASCGASKGVIWIEFLKVDIKCL